ncbi:MAG TPA: Do family serine endopeptidase [Rhizobiales bacterium]|nr:putative periplasmic serine endoprotease DegP-like precursor [bacterium BMS3Bbin10]HDO52874.1 Do family serine endopeptidase [Hyphomicrobiales bacterium]
MKKTSTRPVISGFGFSWDPRKQGFLRISAFAAVCLLVLVSALAPSAFSQSRGPKSVADLAEKLQGAVVNISTTQTLKGTRGVPLPRIPKGSPFEEFFEDFFNRQQRSDRPRQVNSLGSGFVIDSSGLIVTNNHVISGAEEIFVKFSDDTKLKVVEVVGTDSKTDLALLRVKPEKPLTALEFGDSTKMRVGDWVMAIGNPFGLGGTVTLGIISAKKRDINSGPYDEFIQTDAAINRGNSGGPLFDMEGKVIGVNTAIISPSGGSIGIGFAVPAKTVVHVVDQLRRFGETRRGWLGVHIQRVTDGIAESLGMDKATGALVANVAPGSPAEKSGIKVGDVVLSFDGTKVESMRNLPRLVARTAIGKTVEVEILRDEKKKILKVTIAKLAKKEAAKAEIKESKEAEKTSLLGLSISPMSAELRSRFKIGKDVNGVVVTDVDPDSDAAKKRITAGNVIVEVKGKELKGKRVQSVKDVQKAVEEARKSGRSSVLLLIASGTGGVRFVALSLE